MKMYLIWEPSNHGEKARIAAKYGKVSSPTASQSPSRVVFSPPLYLDLHPILYTPFANAPAEQCPTSRKCKLHNTIVPTHDPLHSLGGRPRNLVINIPHLSPPRKAYNLAVKATPRIPKSPSSLKRQPKAKKPPRKTIVSSSEEDFNSASSRDESDSKTKEATPNSQKSGHSEFRVMKHDHVLSPGPSYKHVLHAEPLLEHVQPRPISCEECKQ